MIKKNLVPCLIISAFIFIMFFSCTKKDTTAIETCHDNIKNQNETNIDCGGICHPCPPLMTAKINGSDWVADTAKITASYSSSGSEFKLQGKTTNFYPAISLVYLGTFSLGAHDLNHSSSLSPSFTGATTFASSGTLTISELDTRNNLISGSFNFNSADASSTYTVTEGTFVNISYKLN